MRKMLFLLLSFPLFVQAQSEEHERAFLKSIPDSLVQRIQLPQRDYNPNFSIDDTVNYRIKTRVFIITSDSVYKKLFWRHTYTKDSLLKYKQQNENPWSLKWIEEHLVDSIPPIDFSKNELLLYSACGQCLAYCENDEGHDSCHRNVCMFQEAWFIREKKIVGSR